MRLRTFESFSLLKNGLLYTYPSLTQDVDTQIAVIGAGITGALVSHALIEKGFKVILLDKRDVATGSSSATTSMLQYEIDLPLVDLAVMIGEEGAVRCYRAGIDAIRNLDKLVSSNKIDCGFQSKESLYIAHSKAAAKKLLIEFQLRDKHNLGVRWLSKEEAKSKYSIICYGAILSEVGASVDAYKLAHELIQQNSKRGMLVFDQTSIEKFDMEADRPLLHIEGGHQVTCDKVIFCTGFEATAMLKENVAKLFFTYACVSESGISLNEELKKTLLWDTDRPYTYMRATEDGRLLVGGEDASNNRSFFQQKIKELKAVKLVKKLERLVPGIQFTTDFAWAGTFGSTKDGLPYIGESAEYKNAFFVLGFGGNGITFSVQAMEIIPQLLDGKEHPLCPHYAFGR